MEKIKIIFFGTSNFAVPILTALNKQSDKFEIVLVVTQSVKLVGRKQIIVPSPVAEFAKTNNLPLTAPAKIRTEDFLTEVTHLKPDVFVVAAYGKILPQNLLDVPKFGALNLHGSILPKYRGASPIQNALLNCDAKTGVSLMLMDAEVDHGPVLAIKQLDILADDNFISLESKLGQIAGDMLTDSLPNYIGGKIKSTEQDHTQTTFTKITVKNDGLIEWQKITAVEIEAKLKAYTPWPGIWTKINHKNHELRMKILSLKVISNFNNGKPGLVQKSEEGFMISALEGVLLLTSVQIEGKNVITGREFMLGYQDLNGRILA